jgi:pimeloyl-ACP methyl ester carboxylesterase
VSQADLRPVLATLSCPVLWIDGDDDWVRTTDAANWNSYHHIEHVTIAEAGHFPFIEQPDMVAHAIAHWAARVCSPARPA